MKTLSREKIEQLLGNTFDDEGLMYATLEDFRKVYSLAFYESIASTLKENKREAEKSIHMIEQASKRFDATIKKIKAGLR